MAAQGDLTTIDSLKEWLNSDSTKAYPTTNDALLARLITAASTFIPTYLSAPVSPADVVEARNGSGTQVLFLRSRPVISVASLAVNGLAVPARTSFGGPGYAVDDSRIMLPSGFPEGLLNVSVGYSAGYQASEAVVASASVPVASLSRPWNRDRGATLAGIQMALVAGTPAHGQYALVQAAGAFAYQFATADFGEFVGVNYGYTPPDIEQAAIELAGERLKVRNRIGQVSVNFGNGQVAAFSQKDMNDSVKTLLNQYRNVTPCP